LAEIRRVKKPQKRMREIHYRLVNENYDEILKGFVKLENGDKIEDFKREIKKENVLEIATGSLQVYNNKNLLEYDQKIDDYGKSKEEALVVVVPSAGGVGKFIYIYIYITSFNHYL
jgi:hypothetical protein